MSDIQQQELDVTGVSDLGELLSSLPLELISADGESLSGKLQVRFTGER